jgi:hypothetical protein
MEGNAFKAAPRASLPIDHMVPAKGESNRVSNLTIACAKYNQMKGGKDLKDLLAKSLKLLMKIKAQAKAWVTGRSYG